MELAENDDVSWPDVPLPILTGKWHAFTQGPKHRYPLTFTSKVNPLQGSIFIISPLLSRSLIAKVKTGVFPAASFPREGSQRVGKSGWDPMDSLSYYQSKGSLGESHGAHRKSSAVGSGCEAGRIFLAFAPFHDRCCK